MNCSSCAFFTNNSALLCAVNPMHCQPLSEPCKEFELSPDFDSNGNPKRIYSNNYTFTYEYGSASLMYTPDNGKVYLYDSEIISDRKLDELQLYRDNPAIKKFLSYCTI